MRLLIFLILLPFTVHASEPVKRTIFDKEVIDAIIQVESLYSTGVVGDSGMAVGCLQIWKITVRDVNRILGRQKYQYSDRTSRQKSIEMFLIYQRHYNQNGDLEKGCRIWNGGPDGYKQEGTKKYYKKVLKVLAERK